MSVKDEEKVYRELLQNAPKNQQSTATAQSQNALQSAENSISTVYTGKADAKVDEAINKYLNSRGFNYNTADDEDYQNYVAEVRQNAQQGRDISKKTATTLANGYTPTYADTVASEVYNSQLENITDAIPTFKNLAQQQNYNEQARQAEIANLYAQQAQQEYSRNRDTVNDNKAFLNYLYNRYLTDTQNDVQKNANEISLYATQLDSAQNNLAEAQSYDNQRYLYNTQSADNRATLAQQEYENNQKIAYQKAEDEYNARVEETKAELEKNERVFKKTVNDYIEAYDLKNASYDFVATQIAIGGLAGILTKYEMEEISKELGVNAEDVAIKTDLLEKEDKKYGNRDKRSRGA